MSRPIVLAAVAHPDDIEFMMAGTALLLAEAGAELHFWNLANGGCGSAMHPRDEIARLRWAEAQASAAIAGATLHRPLFDDLAIFYDRPSLAAVASVIRAIRPTIVLTHGPHDYMEDHQNTCRLITTATFARGMANFPTNPQRPSYDTPVAIYHAMPHGLRDAIRGEVTPECFVDVGSVLEKKRAMLAAHRSQQHWLDVSQGMNAYLQDMEQMTRAMGRMSGKFEYAEAWRRHSHLGLATVDYDPLHNLLTNHFVSR